MPTYLPTDFKNAQNVYKIQSKANDYLESKITSKNRRKTFKGSFEVKTLTDMTNIKLHNHFLIAVFC